MTACGVWKARRNHLTSPGATQLLEHLARSNPVIVGAMPVAPLGRTHASSHPRRIDLVAALPHMFADECPRAIDDLGPCFCVDHLAIGHAVLHEERVAWSNPLVLAGDLHFLFFMDHPVVDDCRERGAEAPLPLAGPRV